MLGPVMISMRRESSKARSFGTKFAPLNCSTTGCRPDSTAYSGSSTSVGATQPSASLRSVRLASASMLAMALGALLQRRQLRDQFAKHVLVELALARERLVARAEHFILEAFELRRDEALCGFHRLPAQVVGRHALGMRARDLDEESLHAVVAKASAARMPLRSRSRCSSSSRNSSVLVEMRRSWSSAASKPAAITSPSRSSADGSSAMALRSSENSALM